MLPHFFLNQTAVEPINKTGVSVAVLTFWREPHMNQTAIVAGVQVNIFAFVGEKRRRLP